MTEPTTYLGELMVHKASRRSGPIVRAATPTKGKGTQLTLKTFDGCAIQGPPSEFAFASQAEYFSYVDGFLSDVSVASY